MNQFEYFSKTMLLYSQRKNERIDLSCLPDDVFDKVLNGLDKAKICVEGSTFTGKFIMNSSKVFAYTEWLKEVADEYPRINRLIAYLTSLKDGDVFRIVSEDAPTLNKQLAVLKIKGLDTGLDEHEVHNSYLLCWGGLSMGFHHLAFGYDGLKTVVGEGVKENRVCRFCGKKKPEVKYNCVAHAISEGLGNKLLFCNEECDCCNNKLSKTESNLMHYLDVRRAMSGVLSKTDGTVPSVDGKGFVIRGDKSNQAILYVEKEALPKDLELGKPFRMRLETVETITHQGIYKSLCKIVIDLLPSIELEHFSETIGWINGRVLDSELPPYFASYNQESVMQPTVDIFLSKSPGTEPYCTAIVHIIDVLFAFILPEVDVDKAQYKTEDSILHHMKKFMDTSYGVWFAEDSSEYTLSNPWVDWDIYPDDPHVQIRPQFDPVFMRYKRECVEKDEQQFPTFVPIGISSPMIRRHHFSRHINIPVSVAELNQVSVNYGSLLCTLDKSSSTASFSMSFNFSDSSNRISYFDFSFDAEVKLEDFGKYIKIEDYFSIDYHLRDYLCEIVMNSADVVLYTYTVNTDLAPITLKKVIDRRTIRQIYYRIPVDGSRYYIVKDATIHNL